MFISKHCKLMMPLTTKSAFFTKFCEIKQGMYSLIKHQYLQDFENKNLKQQIFLYFVDKNI